MPFNPSAVRPPPKVISPLVTYVHEPPPTYSSSYKLVQAKNGPAFDNATMAGAVVLDASIGPPYDMPSPQPASYSSPRPSSSSSPAVAGVNVGAGPSAPPPPDTGIVSSCTSKLYIGEEFGNYNGVLHGGAAGVIFDMLTTVALGPIARPGFWS